jgi:hypothetical protein
MKRSAKSNRWYLVIIAVVFSALSYFSYQYFFVTNYRAPVAIDVISTLTYGEVALEGIVQKDAPVGKKGEYVLFADSGNYIILQTDNIDPYINRHVYVTGTLSPPKTEGGKAILTVKTLKTI